MKSGFCTGIGAYPQKLSGGKKESKSFHVVDTVNVESVLNLFNCSPEKSMRYGQIICMKWVTKQIGAEKAVLFRGKYMLCACEGKGSQIFSNILFKEAVLKERITSSHLANSSDDNTLKLSYNIISQVRTFLPLSISPIFNPRVECWKEEVES